MKGKSSFRRPNILRTWQKKQQRQARHEQQLLQRAARLQAKAYDRNQYDKPRSSDEED